MTEYQLIHTAEDIDHKLDLLEKNKNFLTYPYVSKYPSDPNVTLLSKVPNLTDIGDGSILANGNIVVTGKALEILLADETQVIQTAGTYIASLGVTNANDEAVTNPGFSLKIVNANTGTVLYPNAAGTQTFSLSAQAAIKVYLVVPNTIAAANLLIKPQIEQGTEVTFWRPYMKTVNTYVDNRFNSLRARALTSVNGKAGQVLGYLEDNVIGAMDLPAVTVVWG